MCYRNFRTFTTPAPTQFVSLAADKSGEIICAGTHIPDIRLVYENSAASGRLQWSRGTGSWFGLVSYRREVGSLLSSSVTWKRNDNSSAGVVGPTIPLLLHVRNHCLKCVPVTTLAGSTSWNHTCPAFGTTLSCESTCPGSVGITCMAVCVSTAMIPTGIPPSRPSPPLERPGDGVNFIEMPTSILHYIFFKLRILDILRCLQVCKAWYAALDVGFKSAWSLKSREQLVVSSTNEVYLAEEQRWIQCSTNPLTSFTHFRQLASAGGLVLAEASTEADYGISLCVGNPLTGSWAWLREHLSSNRKGSGEDLAIEGDAFKAILADQTVIHTFDSSTWSWTSEDLAKPLSNLDDYYECKRSGYDRSFLFDVEKMAWTELDTPSILVCFSPNFDIHPGDAPMKQHCENCTAMKEIICQYEKRIRELLRERKRRLCWKCQNPMP
ncbi:hypothetical protein SELMODRAFT_406529 [Selaginella moellendorffii]|uniref:F-box domain-containing protein n=1 Tax=Selaginella moellendorffii TaxID=88036 RepID=D8R2P0_SELML|nr:hypothetical protein SELMODRAFT_406529 [Selaginella moellendorffii]